MKRALLLAGVMLLIVGSVFFKRQPDKNSPTIFISKVVDHPALNTTTQGIIDTLALNGYNNVRVESAQASPILASQIAQKFINQKPVLLVGVGTLTAQSFLKHNTSQDINIVFSSVTDPEEAGLIHKNITGVSNFVDLQPQLEMLKKIQPQLKRLGIMYNPGELNSISLLKKLEAFCQKMDITLVKQSANKTTEIPQAAVKLAHNVEAIFISNDNTALSGLQSIIKAAQAANIPVYVSDTDAVSMGALASLGPNQYDIGVQTGNMLIRLLKGSPIVEQKIEFPAQTDLYLNQLAAKKAGIIIPSELLEKATKVITE